MPNTVTKIFENSPVPSASSPMMKIESPMCAGLTLISPASLLRGSNYLKL
jgi:hypothetical protein